MSLLGYIVVTIDYARAMRINDPSAKLWVSLYVDSDVGLSPDMKLTSGFIIALQGPDLVPVILWESKIQKAASRSAEAECVALSTALFWDAISLLAVSQRVIASTYVLKYMTITKQCWRFSPRDLATTQAYDQDVTSVRLVICCRPPLHQICFSHLDFLFALVCL